MINLGTSGYKANWIYTNHNSLILTVACFVGQGWENYTNYTLAKNFNHTPKGMRKVNIYCTLRYGINVQYVMENTVSNKLSTEHYGFKVSEDISYLCLEDMYISANLTYH